jgi:hypothetical protein
MYSDTEVSSLRKIFRACFILSNEVDFQINSIVNFISLSVGGDFEFFSSKHISSVAVIFEMWPRDFHVVMPSAPPHYIFSSSPGTSLTLSPSLGNIKYANLFLERDHSQRTLMFRWV